LTADSLFNNYVMKSKPVVLPGLVSFWMSDEKSFNKSFFSDKFGDDIVKVSVSQSGRFDGPEDGALWGLSSNVDVLVR